jgi:hypothetical protein
VMLLGEQACNVASRVRTLKHKTGRECISMRCDSSIVLEQSKSVP